MKKKLLYKLLIILCLIAASAMAILMVYLFKIFNNSSSFRIDLLLGGIGSIISIIVLIGVAFHFMIKVIGDK